MIKLGIDLGGTKIEIIAINEQGEELLRKRVATPQRNYQQIIDTISQLVLGAENDLGIVDEASGESGGEASKNKGCTCLGIGTPGAISPATGLMKNSNSTCLNGQPFLQDLEKSLNKQVLIENDANCFALSEAIDGAAKGAEIVFGVIVGTGTGAGIVIDQQVLKGANALSGEWGHNPLPWPKQNELPGMDCYCGKQGCIETWLSGKGFAQNYLLKYGKHNGRELTSQQIVSLAESGNEQCEQALCEYEDRMARGLAHVINMLDPHTIVLGGGMSNIARLYQNVPRLWGQYVFSDSVITRLVPPKFGDSSGVRGAAWLCN